MKQLLAKFFMPSTLYDNGTNSPWDEQSVRRTARGTNSPGTNRPGANSPQTSRFSSSNGLVRFT